MSISTVYKTSDGKEFNHIIAAERHEESLLDKIDDDFIKYCKGYTGKRLLSKHSLGEVVVWKISGEDPNPDFGGHHHNPYLKTVRGKLEDVIKNALKTPKIFTWGGGGEITKIDIDDV